MELLSVWLSYLQLLSLPTRATLLLMTAGSPTGARLSLVLCGPLPTLQTSPPASGCLEIQHPPSPAWPPSCATCLFLSLPCFPASWAPGLLPHPAGKHAGRSGAASALSALWPPGRAWVLGGPEPALCSLRSGSPSPGRASLRGWHWPSSLPCLGSPSLPVTPLLPWTEGLLPASACDPSAPLDEGLLPTSACDPSAPPDEGLLPTSAYDPPLLPHMRGFSLPLPVTPSAPRDEGLLPASACCCPSRGSCPPPSAPVSLCLSPSLSVHISLCSDPLTDFPPTGRHTWP